MHHGTARITTRWQETVAGILDVSRMLVQAKAEVGHGNWLNLVAELPFGESTARRLLAVGALLVPLSGEVTGAFATHVAETVAFQVLSRAA